MLLHRHWKRSSPSHHWRHHLRRLLCMLRTFTFIHPIFLFFLLVLQVGMPDLERIFQSLSLTFQRDALLTSFAEILFLANICYEIGFRFFSSYVYHLDNHFQFTEQGYLLDETLDRIDIYCVRNFKLMQLKLVLFFIYTDSNLLSN